MSDYIETYEVCGRRKNKIIREEVLSDHSYSTTSIDTNKWSIFIV